MGCEKVSPVDTYGSIGTWSMAPRPGAVPLHVLWSGEYLRTSPDRLDTATGAAFSLLLGIWASGSQISQATWLSLDRDTSQNKPMLTREWLLEPARMLGQWSLEDRGRGFPA